MLHMRSVASKTSAPLDEGNKFTFVSNGTLGQPGDVNASDTGYSGASLIIPREPSFIGNETLGQPGDVNASDTGNSDDNRTRTMLEKLEDIGSPSKG